MTKVLAATAFAALLSGAALAQAPQQGMSGMSGAPAKPAPSTTAPAPTTAPATTTAPASTAAKTASKALAAPMVGTQLWKQAVYDMNEARIGEIDNLVISPTGQITEAVIGVGGFLGIGEKAVAVPYTDLKPLVRDGNIWFQINTTKDKLNSAPSFDVSKYKH